MMGGLGIDKWLDALVARHTQSLSRPEFLKAVRALSARYVERRAEIRDRSPVDSAGKRAAFAAFFAPLHLLTTREIARVLSVEDEPITRIVDLGSGTGAASAGWALTCERPPELMGVDRQSWPLDEAAWNWRTLGLHGRTRRADLVRAATDLVRRKPGRDTAVLAAWSINELDAGAREELRPILLTLAGMGCRVLVIEPLALSAVPWWNAWAREWEAHNGRADEWKFAAPLPPLLAELSDAAGFKRDTLGARTLWLASHGAVQPARRPMRRPMLRSTHGVRRQSSH
jgi:hypothetical protein